MRIYQFLIFTLVFVACKTENSTENSVSIQTTHTFGSAFLKVKANGETKQEAIVKGIYDNWNLGYFPEKVKFSANLTKLNTDSAGWVKFTWYNGNTPVKRDSIHLELSDTLGVSEYLN
jgi:hypothetical protein